LEVKEKTKRKKRRLYTAKRQKKVQKAAAENRMGERKFKSARSLQGGKNVLERTVRKGTNGIRKNRGN